MAIWPYSRVRGGEKTCLLSSSWNDHFSLSDKRRPGPRGMWPRCSPAADHGCPGRETSAQTIFGSLPPATPLLQMALALGSKASSSPVVASHPHLLSSCWQQGAARTVYQLLTHTIFVSQRLHGCVQPISSGPSQKNTEKAKASWVLQTNTNITLAHPKVGLQVT